MKRELPRAPYHSEEPADWFMYVDLLQDAGASHSTWQKALRIARSLETSPRLFLLARYGTRSNPYWDRPIDTLSLFFTWFRPEWLQKTGPGQTVCANSLDWYGTPQNPASQAMQDVVTSYSRKRATHLFFHIHSLRCRPWADTQWVNSF